MRQLAATWGHNTRSADEISVLLRKAGLRPTRQRLALGKLLFTAMDRHVTAETLHGEAVAAGSRVSLATVYNTLKQFRQAGLLRELAIDGAKTYFDTNTSNHSHFYDEHSGDVIDIPSESVRIAELPAPPSGTRVTHVDVIIRIERDKTGH